MGKETGTIGQGYGGESKYDAANAPVDKFGGNSAIHDGIVTEQAPGKVSAPSTQEGNMGASGKGMGGSY